MADRLEELHRDRIELTFSQARALAAAELVENETPVFPHYSLLEGHDRFDRLPNDGRKFKPLHRQSCDFPSPVEMFDQLGMTQVVHGRAARPDRVGGTEALLRREGVARAADVLAHGDRSPRCR